jgi:CO/xanthine dehydrogenase Mo-binding subunit
VDTAKAREAPDVVAVLTGDDLTDLPDHRPSAVVSASRASRTAC